MSDPSVLLMHRPHSENVAGVNGIKRAIRAQLPELDLQRAINYDETFSPITEAEIGCFRRTFTGGSCCPVGSLPFDKLSR